MIGRRLTLIGFLWLFVAGCTSHFYDDTVGGKPSPPAVTLATLPHNDYWSGLAFRGDKIGFIHTTVRPAGRLYLIEAEAVMNFRFMAANKRFVLKSRDWVRGDLTLVHFESEMEVDDSRSQVKGEVADGTIRFTTVTKGTTTREHIPIQGDIFPSVVINILPYLRGLAVGKRYDYQVFNTETRGVGPVKQEVVSFQGHDLFPGQAFQVHTQLEGQDMESWLSPDGRPLLEYAVDRAFVSTIESEESARQFLVQGALNKNETLLDFSRVVPDRPLPDARRMKRLTLLLSGVPPHFVPLNRPFQHCVRQGEGWLCQMDMSLAAPAERMNLRYLEASSSVNARAGQVLDLFQRIVGKEKGDGPRIKRILAWMQGNIERAPVDVFNALDVLEQGKAECQGHAFLFAALARAAGIATRVVNGLIYSEELGGFLYHTWNESLVDGRWRAVDPTYAQFPVDATHLALMEGELLADLMPMVELMGKVKIRIPAQSAGGSPP